MVDEPHSGLLAEDNEESEEFLCAVAAECLNDALLVLEHVEIGIKIDLQQLLSMLLERATVHCSDLKETQSFKPQLGKAIKHKLSPAAREIVESYIECATAKYPDALGTVVAAKQALQNPGVSRTRQRVVLHLMEALSLLREEDLEIATPLQVAIDRARKRNLIIEADSQPPSSRKPN